MSPLRGVRRYFRLPASRSTVERDVDEEMAFHLAMRIEELEAEGLSSAEAQERAHREYGDVLEARTELARLGRRRVRRGRNADRRDVVRRDVLHALRMLVREPGFSLAVILTLAVGLGVNAVMFGITDRLLFRAPPGIGEPEDVSRVYFRVTLEGYGTSHYPVTTWPQYENLRALPVIEDAGVLSHRQVASYGTGRDARPVKVATATGSLFTTLQVQPSRGRFFTDAESRDGSAVAVVSTPFWLESLGGEPVTGRRIRVGLRDYEVVGVAPPGFTGVDLEPVDVWLPIGTAGAELAGSGWNTTRMQWLRVLVRHREDVPAEAAAQAMSVAAREVDVLMGMDSASAVTLEPLVAARVARGAVDGQTAGSARVALWLSGVGGVVLLIACANVANLLLARALRRRREIGVRLALGAGRMRIAAQLVTETLFLAVLGAAAGLVLAGWTGSFIRAMVLPEVEWAGRPLLDTRLLVFAGIALLLTVILAGLAPALHAVREDVIGAIGLGARGTVRRSRLRTLLVVTQTALSVVLLTGAALFVMSLRNAQRVDLGFDAAGLSAVRWNSSSLALSPEEQTLLYEETLRRVRALPQVEGAAMTAAPPLMRSISIGVSTPGTTLPENDRNAHVLPVSTEYLRVSGTPLLRGRDFTAGDVAGSEPVTLVSESLADHLWPGRDGTGECLQYGDVACARVVGVIRGVRGPSADAEQQRMFLVPLAQAATVSSARSLVVRTRGGEAGMQALREAVQSVRPELGHIDVESYAEVLEPMLRPWQLGARLFTAFGVLALALAALGLYGIIAYDVTQRQPEMSVRIALGARRNAVARLILMDAARMVAAGALLGIGGALLVADRLQPLLFDASPRDPRILLAACALLGLTGIAAAALPAWRASRADPIRAMTEA